MSAPVAADSLTALQAEVERLTRERDEALAYDEFYKRRIANIADLVQQEIERREAAERRVEELREAALPFRNIANAYDDQLDPDDRPVGPFQLGLFRRARAAYNGDKHGPE